LLGLGVLALVIGVGLGGARPRAFAEAFGPDDFRVSVSGPDTSGDNGARMPAAAFNPDAGEYFVVWSAMTTTTTVTTTVRRYEIMGQRIQAASGTLVGGAIQISRPAADPLQTYVAEIPAVVYNPVDRRYLVLWAREETSAQFGNPQVHARFVDAASGAPLGIDSFVVGFDRPVGISGNNIFDESRLAVAYSPTARRYFAVATVTDEKFSYRAVGRPLAADGGWGGPEVSFTAPMPNGQATLADLSPAVTYNPTADEFFVTWLGSSYWYLFDRGPTFIYGQRVRATTGAVVAPPVLIAGSDASQLPTAGLASAPVGGPGEVIQLTPTLPAARTDRPALPVVAYHAVSDSYLVTWIEGRYYSANYGPVAARWVATSGNPAGAQFYVPMAAGCGAEHVAVQAASSTNTAGVVWSTGNAVETPGCAQGVQVWSSWLRGLQRSGLPQPEQLSQVGPQGGSRFRAMRPAVVFGNVNAQALTVWYGNDEAPGLDPDKLEVYGQLASGFTARTVLPLVQREFAPPFDGRAEREPNNSASAANGPLVSGQSVTGLPNDSRDFYRFGVSRTGAVSVELNGMTATGAQLQVLDQALNRVGYDGDAPYRIDLATVAPGTYYVYIFTTGNFNTVSPYSLRVTFP
jgi:hypothetical protein